jgi:tetratricopeptide (TPR) repeat protein
MSRQSTGTSYKRPAGAWRILLALLLNLPALAIEPGQSSPNLAATYEARQHLRSAVELFDRKDTAGAQSQVLAAIDSPAFASLSSADQHAAWALAATLAMQKHDFTDAQQFAARATQMQEQTVEDWRTRLEASSKIPDPKDEAACLTAIVRQWGRDKELLPDVLVRRVMRETDKPEATEARLELLEALFELRWRPADGGNFSGRWRELSRLLLERNRRDDAVQVAALVDDPFDIIAFHADLRLRPLLKSDKVRSNARRAAEDQIQALRDVMRQQPRSLNALHRLMLALLRVRKEVEVLGLAAEAERRVDAVGAGAAPYDDMGRYGFILEDKSRALWHLGRFDEAVTQLRRALELPNKTDEVSQPIDYALFLCELDRPDEALGVLPDEGKISGYGRMLSALVRLSAAVERNSPEDLEHALIYLREHREDSATLLQVGLLRAGLLDEAEQVLLWRLNDPQLRTLALLEVQKYFEPKRPPRAQEWHERDLALEGRPAVHAAILQFGEIDSYAWTYGFD